MLVKAKKVIGLKIITRDEGKEIDKVRDIIYDPKMNSVTALLIDEGGWFSDAKVLLISDIESIGKDAVMIRSEKVIRKVSDVSSPIANIAREEQFLTKTKIMTQDGNDLGRVSDLIFDSHTGAVVEFEVSQGIIKDIGSGVKKVKISDITTIGEDVIIVRTYTGNKFEERAQYGGIQGSARKTMEPVKEKTQDYAKEAKRQAVSLSQQAKTKALQIQQSPRTHQIAHSLKEMIYDLNEDARSASEALEERFSQMREDPQNRRKLEDIKTEGKNIAKTIGKGLMEFEKMIRSGVEQLKQNPEAQKIVDDTKDKAVGAKRRAQEVAGEAEERLQKGTGKTWKKAQTIKRQTKRTVTDTADEEEEKAKTETRFKREESVAGMAGGESVYTSSDEMENGKKMTKGEEMESKKSSAGKKE